MEQQRFAIIEATAALIAHVLLLVLRMDVLRLLYSDRFVFHAGWTLCRHHRNGLVALAAVLLLLLNRMDFVLLMLFLLHEMLLFNLLLMFGLLVLQLLHLLLLLLLLVVGRRLRLILLSHGRQNVVNDSLMRIKLGFCAEPFAAVEAAVGGVRMVSHVCNESSLL